MEPVSTEDLKIVILQDLLRARIVLQVHSTVGIIKLEEVVKAGKGPPLILFQL